MILQLIPKSDKSWLFAEFELSHRGTPMARFYLFRRNPLLPDGNPPAQKTTPCHQAISGRWVRPLEAKFSPAHIWEVVELLKNLDCNYSNLVDTAYRFGWETKHIHGEAIKVSKALAELTPRLTDEFLETLVMAVSYVGWSVDMVETENFVRECFHLVDKEAPKIEEAEYDS